MTNRRAALVVAAISIIVYLQIGTTCRLSFANMLVQHNYMALQRVIFMAGLFMSWHWGEADVEVKLLAFIASQRVQKSIWYKRPNDSHW